MRLANPLEISTSFKVDSNCSWVQCPIRLICGSVALSGEFLLLVRRFRGLSQALRKISVRMLPLRWDIFRVWENSSSITRSRLSDTPGSRMTSTGISFGMDFFLPGLLWDTSVLVSDALNDAFPAL